MGDCQESEPREGHEAQLRELCRAYAAALLYGDETAAELAIRDALEAKLTTAEIDDEVIAPALWLVGELWARGEISVADEHIATEISMRMLALQREAQRVAAARAGHRALLAAPSGEQHTVALRMISNLLRSAGYDVVMLGGEVPADALAAASVRHEPGVICLTSTMPGGSDQVRLAIEAVHEQWPSAGFVLGGRSLASRVRARPRVDVCERVSEVVEAVDALIKRADLN